jgi:hypothetical protein
LGTAVGSHGSKGLRLAQDCYCHDEVETAAEARGGGGIFGTALGDGNAVAGKSPYCGRTVASALDLLVLVRVDVHSE